jgi:hypothetical protein
MTPMRANIVGPPVSATKISASIAVCHAKWCCSVSGSFVIELPASRQSDELLPFGEFDRFFETSFPAAISRHAAA